ncbi:ubiquitin carboxyl-terminal hydrolase 48-like isoform X2 [Hippoglossus stenolepis]|uniref:ubiquitin carboxyl-terminal hydrolase 48-like isoform X2 n=1 Tax=Hippoglossus stenolepis TaxID=195615 RepID=UPI001FAF0DFE|nr:ubiquitin carboxyl-terminal hydrolase 48-like isoform X2 [Hippoglossus stenolepis]
MMSCLYTGLPNTPADIKYHGLFNQGATCYLNSVLQVLFMTEDFREAVERCAHHNPECIDPQLRDVFVELLERPSYTYKITKKLGIHTVYEQRDAAEYFEKILTLTSSDASQIFHGESTHKITCSHCRKENNTDGRFWHLPLELVDSHSDVYSVVDGIDEYFRTSHFSGENQMYCDRCESKSDATMTCVMKHHPEVLTLMLKRFDFDYRYMSYVKNNRVVVVPSSLQIPENQWYELYACVEHFGDLRGGHYTAKIKSQDDEKWYSFNDDSVTLLDYQPFQKDNIQRSQSVYLLFYRKKKHIHTQEISEVFTNGGLPLPAAGDDGDECPDVEQITEGEEVEESEETAEVSNGTTESVSFDRNKGTGIKENVSVGSAGVHPICNVEDQDNGAGVRQSKPLNDQECNEESSHTCRYLPDEKQEEDEGEMMKDDEEEERGKAEAEDQAEKRRRLMSEEAQLEERAEDQTCVDAEIDDVRQGRADIYQDLKPEVSDRDATRDRLIEKDEVREVEMDRDGGSEEFEEPKYLDSHAESQDNEESHDVRQTLNEDQGDEQEDLDLHLVSSDKKEDEEEMEVDDSEGKTGANKLTSEPENLTKCPLCGNVIVCDQSPPLVIVDKKAADEKTGTDDEEDKGGKTRRLELLTKNDVYLQGCEDTGGVGAGEQGGSRRLFERSEKQKDERRDEKGDKEQKRGNDEAAQGSTTKPDCSEGVEDQDEGGLVDGGQNGPEETICVHEDVGAEEQAQENKEPSQSGMEELRENQGGEGVEKMENTQPKERAGCKDATVEGGGGSDKTILYGAIIDEEVIETSCGV